MKPTPFDEALRALGLSANEFEPVARFPGSFEARSRSANGGNAFFDLERERNRFPLQRIEADRRLLQLRESGLERRGCALFADKGRDGCFAIESFSAPLRTTGAIQSLDRGLWWLNPSGSGAGALFERFVVLALRDELWIGHQKGLGPRRAPLPEGRALSAEADEGSLRVSESLPHKGLDFLQDAFAPPIALKREPGRPSLLSQFPGGDKQSHSHLTELYSKHLAEPWLSQLTEVYSQDSGLYAQAAGAGLFARLWVPPARRTGRSAASSSTTAETLASLLDSALGEDGPPALAQRWYERLSRRAQDSIEEESLQTVDALQRALPEVCTLVTSPLEGRLQSTVQRWVTVRDDLESVGFLCGRERPRSDLGRALLRLDREAVTHLSTLAEVELDEDPRLRAVSWQEPEAWWGQLAVPRGDR